MWTGRLRGERRGELVVVFDLDGVLIDSWAVCRWAFEEACAGVGLPRPFPVAGFQKNLGRPISVVLSTLGVPAAAAELFRACTVERAGDIQPFPGVPELLAGLHGAGIRLGVLTGKDQTRAVDILQRTGLMHWIEAVVTPDTAPAKPDPRALWATLDRLGSCPADAVYVGDAPVDIETAVAAGVSAVFARWGALHPWPMGGYTLAVEHPEALTGRVVRDLLGLAS